VDSDRAENIIEPYDCLSLIPVETAAVANLWPSQID